MPVTAVAPANIALIKYWGLAGDVHGVPANRSLSMTLTHCVSRCTVEPVGGRDEVWWVDASGGGPAEAGFARRVSDHLDHLRAFANVSTKLRVVTTNSFPTSAGIASSASGFAALTIAALEQFKPGIDPGGLSQLARQSGSGSAARSVLGGFVRWPRDPADRFSSAEPFLSAGHWALSDVIAVVDAEPKAVSSRDGHVRAATSPYFRGRLELLEERLGRVCTALVRRDFPLLAASVEEEMYDMQAIAMTSTPPLRYWKPATLRVLEMVGELRAAGIQACATTDAGPNVHVLCPDDAAPDVVRALEGICGTVILDKVGEGPRLSGDHLTIS